MFYQPQLLWLSHCLTSWPNVVLETPRGAGSPTEVATCLDEQTWLCCSESITAVQDAVSKTLQVCKKMGVVSCNYVVITTAEVLGWT